MAVWLLIASLGAAVQAFQAPRAKGRLADAIAVAGRDDPYWRIDDLMAHREPIAVAANSARVLVSAIAGLPENWPASPALQQADARLFETPDNVRLDDATASALRAELTARAEVVKAVRSMAGLRRGRNERKLTPALIDTPLPGIQETRTATRLLAADAAIRAHDGDLDGALDSCTANLGVARSIGDDPFVISQLVRTAVGNRAVQSVRRVLGQGEPSDAALARLQAAMLSELAEPTLLHGLRGERATDDELIRRLAAGELPISAIGGGALAKVDPGGKKGVLSKAFDETQRAVALEWMNDAVSIARRPSPEQAPLWKAWKTRRDKVKESREGQSSAFLAILLVPEMTQLWAAHTRYQANLGACALLLAAERHRRKLGDWPSSIAAIDRSLLSRPPVDPFTGQPYRVERRDGQFQVYSIGPNSKDEHGAYDKDRWLKGGPDDAAAVAWDVPRRKQPSQP